MRIKSRFCLADFFPWWVGLLSLFYLFKGSNSRVALELYLLTCLPFLNSSCLVVVCYRDIWGEEFLCFRVGWRSRLLKSLVMLKKKNNKSKALRWWWCILNTFWCAAWVEIEFLKWLLIKPILEGKLKAKMAATNFAKYLFLPYFRCLANLQAWDNGNFLRSPQKQFVCLFGLFGLVWVLLCCLVFFLKRIFHCWKFIAFCKTEKTFGHWPCLMQLLAVKDERNGCVKLHTFDKWRKPV